jgi:hypothetical protein
VTLIDTSIFELQIGEIANAKDGWDVLGLQIWVSVIQPLSLFFSYIITGLSTQTN